jgi:hypothetical protein
MTTLPIVFISHFTVKSGHIDAFRAVWTTVIAMLEVSKPATIGQVGYLSDDGARLSIVHVFPDAAALAAHFQGSDDRAAAAYEHIVPAGWELYGRPEDDIVAGLRAEASAAGVTLTVMPELMGGFFRTANR